MKEKRSKLTNDGYQKEIDKRSFIEMLSVATPEQINEVIEEKGKERKRIPVMVFYDRN